MNLTDLRLSDWYERFRVAVRACRLDEFFAAFHTNRAYVMGQPAVWVSRDGTEIAWPLEVGGE